MKDKPPSKKAIKAFPPNKDTSVTLTIRVPPKRADGKKQILSTPASYMPGNARTEYSDGVPRVKIKLEVEIATQLLKVLKEKEGFNFSDVGPNPSDPPDVLFKFQGEQYGVELAELLPEGRLGNDDRINKFFREVLSKLRINEATSNWVIKIFTTDPYPKDFKMRRDIPDMLAAVLNKFFLSTPQKRTQRIPLPDNIKTDINDIIAEYHEELEKGEPIIDKNEPFLTISAQCTLINEEDRYKEVERILGEKSQHDTAKRTWLLLWSQDSAIVSDIKGLIKFISDLLKKNFPKYERIFFVSYNPPLTTSVIEFFNDKEPRVIQSGFGSLGKTHTE